MISFLWLLLLLVESGPASAQVVTDRFDSYAAGDVVCEEGPPQGVMAGSPWQWCKEGPRAGQSCDLSIVSGIAGYSGPMPSGANALRMQADSSSVQTECTLRIGGSHNNYIPANVWLHSAIYIRSAGTSSQGLTNRWMKYWYPCRDPYPCSLGSEGGSWLLGIGRNTNAPFEERSPAGWSADDMVLENRGHTSGTIVWNGTASLGQTSQSEWLKADRWNTLTFNMDNSNEGACRYRAWIAEVGHPPVLVMDWQGGTIVEGFPFTCDMRSVGPVGHQYLSFLSVIPNNNSRGVILDLYLDDVVVTADVADLPAYARPGGPLLPAAPRNLRIRAADSLALLLIPVWLWRRRGTA